MISPSAIFVNAASASFCLSYQANVVQPEDAGAAAAVGVADADADAGDSAGVEGLQAGGVGPGGELQVCPAGVQRIYLFLILLIF